MSSWILSVLVLAFVQLSRAVGEGNCDTQSAICPFNQGSLTGSIAFQETQGFGCTGFGNDEGLILQIDIQGFDTQDGVTAHTFRVKSYVGLGPNCTGMGPDFGKGLRGSDLGTFSENQDGTLRVASTRLQNGPTLIGQRSIAGHSVAVLKGPAFQKGTPEVLGCCIVGYTELPQVSQGAYGLSPTSFTPRGPSSSGGESGDRVSYPAAGQQRQGAGNSAGPQGPSNSPPQGPINSRPQGPIGTSQSRAPSSFRSAANSDSSLPFDLSGKTARANSILPSSIQNNFRAPQAPRFEDIFGLNAGESPLARSGFGGNGFGPSDSSSGFTKNFYNDFAKDVALTPDEKSIPKEKGEDEPSGKGQRRKGASDSGRSSDSGSDDGGRPARSGSGDDPSRSSFSPSSVPSRFGNRSDRGGTQPTDSDPAVPQAASDQPETDQPGTPTDTDSIQTQPAAVPAAGDTPADSAIPTAAGSVSDSTAANSPGQGNESSETISATTVSG